VEVALVEQARARQQREEAEEAEGSKAMK